MKRSHLTATLSALVLAAGLFVAPQAVAGIVFGVSAGAGVVIQDVAPEAALGVDFSADPALTFEGTLGYAFGDRFVVGLTVQYQVMGVDVEVYGAEGDLGDAECLSFLPFLEWHFLGRAHRLSPYLSVAPAFNINSFYVDKDIEQAVEIALHEDYDVEPEDTFGVRAALGLDIFVVEGLAANVEIGWKYNKAEVRETLSGHTASKGDFDASNLIFTAGLRYYF